jgi:hypothetical protein
MARKILVLMAVLAMAAFGAGSAGANFINFDNFPATAGNPVGIEGQHIGPAYPHGVTITSQNGDTAVYFSDLPLWGYVTGDNTVSNETFLVNNIMTFTFDVPRGYVAFSGGDAGGDQDRFEVKLYDSANVNFLTFDSLVFGSQPADPFNLMVDRVDFSYTGAQYAKYMTVEAFSVNYGAGILIDNLDYCRPAPTPIPGSVLLLGSGILGLVGVGMRKKA